MQPIVFYDILQDKFTKVIRDDGGSILFSRYDEFNGVMTIVSSSWLRSIATKVHHYDIEHQLEGLILVEVEEVVNKNTNTVISRRPNFKKVLWDSRKDTLDDLRQVGYDRASYKPITV